MKDVMKTFLLKLLKETPAKMFSYEVCEILCSKHFVLESLVIFRQAWALFLDVRPA